MRSLRSLFRSRSGSGAILFALVTPALLGLAGGAADYAAVSSARSKLQARVDAAALGIAREMTLTPMTDARVQQLATQYLATSDAGIASATSVQAGLKEGGLAVSIRASDPIKTPFGILAMLGGVDTVTAGALARVTASTSASKLCMLSLGTHLKGGLYLHNNSKITAAECLMQSNSGQKDAVIIQQGSTIAAHTICARGGIATQNARVDATLVTDCPSLTDPLASKPEPSLAGACLHTKLVVKSGIRELDPGVYCGGLRVEKTARVTLRPGNYVFRDGPLVVSNNAELLGAGVTLLFTGKSAYFRFLDTSLIRLSAPVSGTTAGMLIWETKSFVVGSGSWQNNGCSNPADDDDDDDNGGNCPSIVPPGQIKPKKTNEHHINSDRAQELTGTIYLPQGLLLIDSRRPVADQSPFTVLVAQKVDLFDGPNLTLNSKYTQSNVPVPGGLGAVGAKQVRLGN